MPGKTHSCLASERNLALVLLSILILAAQPLRAEMLEHDIRPGEGVTELLLSDYFPALKDTPGDTQIYVLEGRKKGGSVLLLGGTHPNEIAGVMAAILAVEKGEITCGRLFVIPYTNNSAARHNEGTFNPTSPQWIELTTSSGQVRRFRYGGRYTQIEDQEADSDLFKHYPSGVEYEGIEARNLNRNHPGRPDGTLTQRISHALFRLVETEGMDIVIDMHESSLTSRLANMLVCHPRALEIGAMAKMDLELEGITLTLEASREEYRGLSHREFGDRTDALAFLTETPNPGQERDIENPDVVGDERSPLALRIRVALKTVLAVFNNYNMMSTEEKAILVDFPSLDLLRPENLGDYYR